VDEQRKALIVSGIHLGDIALALAGLATEIPPWVAGLDLDKIKRDAEDQGISREVEKVLSEAAGALDSGVLGSTAVDASDESRAALQALRQQLAEVIVEPAIARGKFLSATRCLEILDQKPVYVDKYLALAQKHVGNGAWKEAAEALVIASSLELNEGTPLFHYAGPALHEACTASREKCVTAVPREAAVLKGLQYLLEGTRTREAIGAMTPDAREDLLPHVALAGDPDAGAFYRDYKQAHADLEEIARTDLATLRDDLKRAADEIGSFTSSLAGAASGEVERGAALERLLRTGNGLKKDFTDTGVLVDNLELRRIRRRFEELADARRDLEAGHTALKKGSKPASSLDRLLGLIDDLAKKGITEAIDATEEKILATQVTMLGRAVPSQEHWQYLRDLAFKYPVSPLMCCVRRINAKWMVVPAWNSDVAGVLREFLDQPGK